MRAYDNREERLRMDLQGKKRYLIPLGLLLLFLLQGVDWYYLRHAAEVAGRFPEVDRAVVSVEGEAPRTILDPTELAAYKEALSWRRIRRHWSPRPSSPETAWRSGRPSSGKWGR